jgi:hypothetical protein
MTGSAAIHASDGVGGAGPVVCRLLSFSYQRLRGSGIAGC